ncbi:hypothetical protein N7453_006060 [Penicillium expansum]|nr:hypothetical protein N7453_006060 [Penicillium expansum]
MEPRELWAGICSFCGVSRVSVLRRYWSYTAGGFITEHGPVDTILFHAHTVRTFWLFATATNLASSTDDATER